MYIVMYKNRFSRKFAESPGRSIMSLLCTLKNVQSLTSVHILPKFALLSVVAGRVVPDRVFF